MLQECAWYCRDTYAINFRINLQIINNEMMILICLICRYIKLHQFISSRERKICVEYLRTLFRMKAAYIVYFQDSFQEIRFIILYFIIHGSVIIHMCSKAVWWIMRAIQFNWLLQQFKQAYIEMKRVSSTFSCKLRCNKLETHTRIKGVYKDQNRCWCK